MKTKRNIYLLLFFILLLTEIFIALFVHDKIIRPYIGDVLVVIVIYCLLKAVKPDFGRLLPLGIFVFAVGVEVLQYFRIVEILGLSDIAFFRTLIGSVFDFGDIVCYAVGCIILYYFNVEKS